MLEMKQQPSCIVCACISTRGGKATSSPLHADEVMDLWGVFVTKGSQGDRALIGGARLSC